MTLTEFLQLIEFLLARIGADEHRANLARHLFEKAPSIPAGATYRVAALPSEVPTVAVRYMLDWQPSRVLAECEAKRQRIAFLQMVTTPDEADSILIDAATMLLKIDASVYADHPDYRDEWRDSR